MRFRAKREFDVEVFVCDVCGREVGTGRDAYVYLDTCRHCGRDVCDLCMADEAVFRGHVVTSCQSCWVIGAAYRAKIDAEGTRHQEAFASINAEWKAASVKALAGALKGEG